MWDSGTAPPWSGVIRAAPAIAQGHARLRGHRDLGDSLPALLSQGKELKTGREDKPEAARGSSAAIGKTFHGNRWHSGQSFTCGTQGGDTERGHTLSLHPLAAVWSPKGPKVC